MKIKNKEKIEIDDSSVITDLSRPVITTTFCLCFYYYHFIDIIYHRRCSQNNNNSIINQVFHLLRLQLIY